MQRKTLAFWGSLGAILLSFPYILHLFGPTEAEVVMWGRVSLCLGVVLLVMSLAFGDSTKPAAGFVLALGYGSLALLQGLPIFLWFAFHGSGMSDGTPQSAFVAHWAYAIPHVFVLMISLGVFILLVFKRHHFGRFHHGWIVMVLLAACTSSFSASLTPEASFPTEIVQQAAQSPTRHPDPTVTPTFPPPTMTPSPTLTPTPTGPFPRTKGCFEALGDTYPDAVHLRALTQVLITDTVAYLDRAIVPNVPLAEQQAALVRMAKDLPGVTQGQVVDVDLDPGVQMELFVVPHLNGASLLYGRYMARGWQMLPVPISGLQDADATSTAVANLFPQYAEARDLTGDGHPEALILHHFVGGSGWREFVQVLRWNGTAFEVLFRAELVNWAGEATYTLEPDPTQQDAVQIVLSYPHLYSLGFDHKLLNHPLGQQVWRWDPEADRFVMVKETVDFDRSAWGADAEIILEDRLRWLVNQGEFAFRTGAYADALYWYDTAIHLAEVEAWSPASEQPHWSAFAAFRRAEALLLLGESAEGHPAMQAVANAWEGDILGDLARAFLEGYGPDVLTGTAALEAADHGVAAMQSVDLEDHFYHDASGTMQFPMDAAGIFNAGTSSTVSTPEWPRVGTFD